MRGIKRPERGRPDTTGRRQHCQGDRILLAKGEAWRRAPAKRVGAKNLAVLTAYLATYDAGIAFSAFPSSTDSVRQTDADL